MQHICGREGKQLSISWRKSTQGWWNVKSLLNEEGFLGGLGGWVLQKDNLQTF